MRILVTNDDGIDSLGLHILARAMRGHGDVVIAAPDTEYSGAGASLGALHLIQPEIHRTTVAGEAPTVDHLIDTVVGRVLDHLGLEHDLLRRWGSSKREVQR